jgi:N-acetylglutamate synthase-like GNAT family acetyltransferase
MSREIVVREFAEGDAAAFRRLNEEWITRYFKMEAKDEELFADPRGKILERGGRIFFAMKEGEALGCCALLAMGAGEFEVAKMAVTASAQGLGVGRLLMESVVAAARALGAKRLYLVTHHLLTPAIRLYESVGFERVAEERVVASPYERADVFLELWLA